MERAFTSSKNGPSARPCSPSNETTDLLRAHVRKLEGRAMEIERLLDAFFEGDVDFATFERERLSFAENLLQHGDLFETLGRRGPLRGTSGSERTASLSAGSRSLGTMLLSMSATDAAAARARQLRAVVVVLRELTQRECDRMQDVGRSSTMHPPAQGTRP